MLYWICPECGHECSPAIRECPTCTAPPAVQQQQVASERTSASWELLSLAENFQAPPAVALLPAPPTNPEPELSQHLAPLDNLPIKPARPVLPEPIQLNPIPIPASMPTPAVAPAATTPRLVLGLKPAGLKPAVEVTFQAARGGKRKWPNQPAEPLIPRRQSVAFVRAELPKTEHSGLALGDLAQLDTEKLKPLVPHQNGQPHNGQPYDGVFTLAYKPAEPSLVSSHLHPAGESLSELLRAVEATAEELQQSAIRAIHESFLQGPALGLLSAPLEIVTAPAPPTQKWMGSQKPRFTPIAPEHAGRATVTAGPQAPPLAGPSLPPQLLNFDHQNSSLRRHRGRGSWWPISLIVATVLILGVGSLLHFGTQDSDAKTTAVAAPVFTISRAQPAPIQPPVVQEHPAARSVEVAGIRIVTGPNKKPQLQYIVINHSASELTGLNIRIAVRSVEALSDTPLFSVSSIVAALGPNQSKEVRADLNSTIQPSDIPDWQSLRTEVLVAKQ